MARFRFGARIGSGGFGVVSHATRVSDGAPFAVKHLATELLDDEEALRRFRREVRLQRLLQHRNIQPIVGANLSASPPWFITPIAERTLLDEGRAGMSEESVVHMFRGILEGMEYAHDQGVIHRDLKPENILLTHDNEPRIADFGLGKNLLSDSTALTQTTMGMGSFPYVAPEQMIDAARADARADIYGLGKLLQFMLTGQVPVAPGSSVPQRFRYLVQRCLEHLPEDRYQTVGELRVALDQVVQGIDEPRPYREVAAELMARAATGSDPAALAELLRLLHQRFEDEELYLAVVPQFDAALIKAALREAPNEFRGVVAIYDAFVSGGLPFEYCDVVANLYRRIYSATNDLTLRQLLLVRLLDMGRSHNRWHVRDVVAAILAAAKETSEVMMVVDVVRSRRPSEIEWYAESPTLRSAALALPIDEALFGRDSSLEEGL